MAAHTYTDMHGATSSSQPVSEPRSRSKVLCLWRWMWVWACLQRRLRQLRQAKGIGERPDELTAFTAHCFVNIPVHRLSEMTFPPWNFSLMSDNFPEGPGALIDFGGILIKLYTATVDIHGYAATADTSVFFILLFKLADFL